MLFYSFFISHLFIEGEEQPKPSIKQIGVSQAIKNSLVESKSRKVDCFGIVLDHEYAKGIFGP
jgi:hypothetical protein